MTKFKPGDRVAVYSSQCEILNCYKATILNTSERTNSLFVKFDDRRQQSVWPQQCRKLVPKKRRRVWVDYDAAYSTKLAIVYVRPVANIGYTEFVEVKKK